MTKIEYDGVENGAFKHKFRLSCSKCDATSEENFGDVLDDSTWTKIKHNKSNFLYKYTFRCTNHHQNTVVYRFEEVQPARYHIEIISTQSHGLKVAAKKALETIGIILLLAIIPVFIVWLHAITYLTYARNSDLRQDGTQTSATVNDRYEDHGGVKRAAHYELTYSYSVEGESFSDTKEVDHNTYILHDVGDEIDIYYDKENPHITDVASNEELLIDVFLLVIVDVTLLVSAVWIYKKSKASA